MTETSFPVFDPVAAITPLLWVVAANDTHRARLLEALISHDLIKRDTMVWQDADGLSPDGLSIDDMIDAVLAGDPVDAGPAARAAPVAAVGPAFLDCISRRGDVMATSRIDIATEHTTVPEQTHIAGRDSLIDSYVKSWDYLASTGGIALDADTGLWKTTRPVTFVNSAVALAMIHASSGARWFLFSDDSEVNRELFDKAPGKRDFPSTGVKVRYPAS